jgi:hypothetical protein
MKLRALSLALLTLLVATTAVQAQDKPKRPGDISVSEFDTFKNTSFDIVDASHNLKNNVTTIDNEIKNYSGVINTVAPDKLKKDLAALKGSKKEAETLADRISKLADQGKEMVGKAKDVTPKMKSLDATSITNKSIKGLDTAKGYLAGIGTLVDTNVTLITDELKKRKEPIE